jgi:hypothetical protein
MGLCHFSSEQPAGESSNSNMPRPGGKQDPKKQGIHVPDIDNGVRRGREEAESHGTGATGRNWVSGNFTLYLNPTIPFEMTDPDGVLPDPRLPEKFSAAAPWCDRGAPLRVTLS